MAKAKEAYVITHPKTKDGVEDKLIAFISLNKQLSDVAEQLKSVMSIPGIDGMQVVGRYTLQVIIAPSFDMEEVWTEIKSALEVVTAGVIVVGNFKK